MNTNKLTEALEAGMTDREILRDAKEIVAYAVRRGWCSKPVPMKITTKNDEIYAKRHDNDSN